LRLLLALELASSEFNDEVAADSKRTRQALAETDRSSQQRLIGISPPSSRWRILAHLLVKGSELEQINMH
jgi:hypothetical protein